MPARFHVAQALRPGLPLDLPDSAARHVQVLRLQPGAAITLFDGSGGQWQAEVLAIGRKTVTARVLVFDPQERELATAVTLAVGMPANERMDGLVEKATELGVAAVQPLVCERSVLRLGDERAQRKAAHWQAIAAAACEQSGRNRVPHIAAPLPLRAWLAALQAPAPNLLNRQPWLPAQRRWMLSLAHDALPLGRALGGAVATATVLSGPEGGLSPDEASAAQAAGFVPLSLGPRTLRADTAPLAALACIAALAGIATLENAAG